MSEEKETTIQQLKTSMKEMLDLCRTAEQKISSTQAFINYFSPHMDTVTDLLDEIFVLVAWKKFNDHKEAENATKKRQREEEEEKERGRARNSGKKTMGMREILELEANKEKFGIVVEDNKNPSTELQDSIKAFEQIDFYTQNGKENNMAIMDLYKNDPELKSVLFQLFEAYIGVWCNLFMITGKFYLPSDGLYDLLKRRRCTVPLPPFLFIMQLASVVFFYEENNIIREILPLINDLPIKDDPIKLQERLIEFSLREMDYHSRKHEELVFRFGVYTMHCYNTTHSGKASHSEVMSYRPLSQMMYCFVMQRMTLAVVNSGVIPIKKFEGSLPRELQMLSGKTFYESQSPMMGKLMKEVSRQDIKPNRTQLFSEHLFKIFLGPGELEAAYQDHSPFASRDTILCLDSNSYSPYIDFCAACVHITVRGLFSVRSPKKNIYAEEIRGLKVKPEDYRTVFCLVTLYALDIIAHYVTQGKMEYFLENHLIFEPTEAAMKKREPGTIPVWGKKFYVVDHKGDCVQADENNPNVLLDMYFNAIKDSPGGLKRAMTKFLSLK